MVKPITKRPYKPRVSCSSKSRDHTDPASRRDFPRGGFLDNLNVKSELLSARSVSGHCLRSSQREAKLLDAEFAALRNHTIHTPPVGLATPLTYAERAWAQDVLNQAPDVDGDFDVNGEFDVDVNTEHGIGLMPHPLDISDVQHECIKALLNTC